MDMPDGLAKEITFCRAEQFVAFLASGELRSSTWVFRGQSRSEWELQSSLERFACSMKPLCMPEAVERHHLQEFRRQAIHYTNNCPNDEDLLGWLALMRHHGSPSRLLDFSRSPYVAAFFAAEEAARDDTVTIWAIDARELKHLSAWVLRDELCVDYIDIGKRCIEHPTTFSLCDPQVFSRLIGEIGTHALVPWGGPIARVVLPVEPQPASERMLLQQGLFLFPTSLQSGFPECLSNVLRYASKWIDGGVPRERVVRHAESINGGCSIATDKYIPQKRPLLYKLVLNPPAHQHLLRELHRMGLSYASLAPGLDGLSRSLVTVSKIRAICTTPNQSTDSEFGASL
jgi:hypothetical protein